MKKGYDNFHKIDKGKKVKEDESGLKLDFEKKKKSDGKKHDEEKLYHEHHRGKLGKKASEFKEGEKYQKGHSTKGMHNIVKKVSN